MSYKNCLPDIFIGIQNFDDITSLMVPGYRHFSSREELTNYKNSPGSKSSLNLYKSEEVGIQGQNS